MKVINGLQKLEKLNIVFKNISRISMPNLKMKHKT